MSEQVPAQKKPNNYMTNTENLYVLQWALLPGRHWYQPK